ncbi:hypothetical protein B296_00031749 [Ensete ventricosum]|uniref:Uncharacterized protein n=1 Tax=Ensete ventricosum TaxID=4639 RepID=A0A426Y8Y6_ENSVE|nr:hypothetical protein B296_00031749 [Ensete ventricosum]
MHRVDTFENLSGVCWKLVEGIGSLLGWRKGVRQKKTETRRKIIGDSQKACRDLDNVMGSCRKFARRFAKGIGKLVGNAKGDCWEEDWRTCRKIIGGYRNIRELTSKPLRSVGKWPVPWFKCQLILTGMDDAVGTRRETRWKLAEGIGGLSGVRRELVEGDRELARKASRVHRKKTKRLVGRLSGVAEKFAGS